MLQVARLAQRMLGDSAERVVDFLRNQLNEDGGFADRSGKSDLYYTVFGIDGLIALQADVPADRIGPYLHSCGSGNPSPSGPSLDFVHLACLARAWAGLAQNGSGPSCRNRNDILERLERFRTADGGYHVDADAERGTAYAGFLALGAYQDLGEELPNPDGLVRSLAALGTADGAYGNEPGMAQGTTTATAAAVALLGQLGAPVDPILGDWLLARAHPHGGFCATPATPMPDLLSTATALHALAVLHVSTAGVKEACLDFIDTLWTSQGAFFGHWADEAVDSEYTWYALLALGHLSL